MSRARGHVDAAALERLFAEASELGAGERAAFLERACGDDGHLRGAVEALLAHSDDACDSGFLHGAAIVAPSEQMHFAPGHSIGGRYVVERLLGEGGMGAVYLAGQLAPLKRRVAVKVMRPGLASRDAAMRFELERQALALMSHANIASVYDAGVTPDGRRYVVMEYVEGKPITTFARDAQLDIDERLDLLVDVCAAVQHAHQKGILHRDLKPSNVLVTERDGRRVVKVIDFGIAKALEAQHGLRTDLTVTSGFFGTPSYMSPEQFERRSDVDTRSDVYGIGATMYELLCAAPPFESGRLSSVTLDELLRIVRDEVPPRPSECTPHPRDAGQLRGDLDWITMKALAKERDRRYESAAALAEDIRRHRDHEPVSAGPPSTMYRVAKFIRRRRGVVVASAVAATALLTGLAFAMWQARVATDEAETARAVTGFLQEMFRSIDPAMARGETITVLDVLNTSAPTLDARFAERPLVLASLNWTIGSTYRAIGEYAPAERHLRRAIELFEAHRGPTHPNTLAAWSDLAYMFKESNRLGEAERIARAELARAIEAQGPLGDETLALKTTLATTLHAKGEQEESGRLFRETYEGHLERQGEVHRSTILAMTNLAVWMMDSGHPAEAQPIFEKALALCEEVHGPDHPSTLATVDNMGTVLSRQGRFEESLPHAIRAHAKSVPVLGASHPLTLLRGRNLAIAYFSSGRHSEATELAKSLVSAARTKHGAAHFSTIASVEILVTVIGLGGDLEEAERIALAFFNDVEHEAGPVDARTARVARLLEELYDSWKKVDERERWKERKVRAEGQLAPPMRAR